MLAHHVAVAAPQLVLFVRNRAVHTSAICAQMSETFSLVTSDDAITNLEEKLGQAARG